MKLFLQLEVRNYQNSGYEKPLLTFASSLSSDVIGAEMDNQSDPTIADLIIKLVSQSNAIFVFIQTDENEPLGSILKVVNHLLKMDAQLHSIVISGKNMRVENLLSSIQEKIILEKDLQKIKEKIRAFALA
jgi:hypothetical protein